MKIIKCYCGKDILVDDDVYDVLKVYKWNCADRRGVRTWINTTNGPITPYISSFILTLSKGNQVDHKDRNDHNNQISNLREASHTENVRNRETQKNNTSGYKGVTFFIYNQKYAAKIGVNKKRIFLGYFKTPEEAAHAYDKAAQFHFGEFAYLNFPKTENQVKQTNQVKT